MKNNNIIQHLLVQLLNPGMYNKALLEGAIEELKKQDINALMELRFNFQNLKPAVLPIQQEWLDKPFYTFFKDFSKEHELELSNGSIYQINLYNLCLIVQGFKNEQAQTVASEIIKAIKSAPNVDITKIEKINFSNKQCKFEVKINEAQFLTANYDKSSLSEVEQFCIKILTLKEGKDFHDLLSNSKKQETFVALLANNPKDKWMILNSFLIGTKTDLAWFSHYPKISSYLIDDKIFLEHMANYLKGLLSTTGTNNYNTNLYTNFIKTVNKKGDSNVSQFFLDKVMDLPDNIRYKYNSLGQKEAIALSLDVASEYLEKKILKDKNFNHNSLVFLTSNLKVELNKKAQEEQVLKYLELLGQVCQKGFSSGSTTTLQNLIAPIEKALATDLLSLEALKNQSKSLYQLLVQHSGTSTIIQTLLDKGWNFPAKLEALNKSYAISNIKLSKPQVINNEKNLISNSISKADDKNKTPKFKV